MGDLEYEKIYKTWTWDIPKKYNIGVDIIDKHTTTKKKTKSHYIGRTRMEKPRSTPFGI